MDFHAHIWTKEQWKKVPLEENVPGSKYMVTQTDYSAEKLLADGRMIFPDRKYNAVKNLENVYLDTSMVMDPLVLQMVFETIDSKRVLFATDLPVANMRGRRVYVMDHWVDIVLEGYPPSAYRVQTKDIHATFMVYEIILAIRRAAERAQLSQAQLQAIFYDNGMALLKSVRV